MNQQQASGLVMASMIWLGALILVTRGWVFDLISWLDRRMGRTPLPSSEEQENG